MILNIGCGQRFIDGALNIDVIPHRGVHVIRDMSRLPWEWKDNKLDGIHMYHFLEHVDNPLELLMECHRVLKVGGFLNIHVPHSSSLVAVGCLVHHRTFSYNALKDYLDPYFKTTHQRLVWQSHYEWLPIQWLIDLSPKAFERFWGYLVGGAVEVRWVGEKI